MAVRVQAEDGGAGLVVVPRAEGGARRWLPPGVEPGEAERLLGGWHSGVAGVVGEVGDGGGGDGGEACRGAKAQKVRELELWEWVCGFCGLVGAIMSWLLGAEVTRRVETGPHAYKQYFFIVWFGQIIPVVLLPVGAVMLLWRQRWRSLPHPLHGQEYCWDSWAEFRAAWKLTAASLAWRAVWLSFAYMVQDICWLVSLSMTSVAAATTVYNSSTAFVVVFSIVFLGERYSAIKFLAAVVAIGSSALVSFAFEIAEPKDGGETGDTLSNPVLGGVFAFAGAVLYGLYEVAYKRFALVATDDEPIAVVIVLAGATGLGNTFALAPLLPILDWTGVETFRLPPDDMWVDFILMAVALAGFIVSLMAALALLPSPTYVAVGITLTVPGSLVMDALWHGRHYTWPFLLGSLGVILSFFMVVVKEHTHLAHHRWL